MQTPIPVTHATFPNSPGITGLGHGCRIHVNFAWTPADPAAIRMIAAAVGEPCQRWFLGRDLLAAGLTTPAGIGDVTVAPTSRIVQGTVVDISNRTNITLRDSAGIGGNITITLPTDALTRFLNRTYNRVAAGDEVYDFDIADLIEQGEGAA